MVLSFRLRKCSVRYEGKEGIDHLPGPSPVRNIESNTLTRIYMAISADAM